MVMKVSLKGVGKAIMWSLLGLFIVWATYLGTTLTLEVRKPAQIITWQPAKDSPYVCYVAVQGPNRVLAMDCLDTSLTVAPKVVP